MFVAMLKGKIHGARVTAADLDYEGSILIDASLMEGAGIIAHEKVSVWNRTNAQRFETYAIPAPPDSRTVMVNGAAAHLVRPGDELIIAAFCHLDAKEATAFSPRVVLVDEKNQGRLKE